MGNNMLNVAIIGTGNIGTDLMIKAIRSPYLSCKLFSGRNFSSNGMQKANALGVPISDRGIEAVIDNPEQYDLIFDATSAISHERHWQILKQLGKAVIDMTPAKIGDMCIPAINAKECISDRMRNINMVTCGGQSSVPIAFAISRVHSEIEYIEVASSIASRSAGPATRANLDEYIDTTELALKSFSGAKKAKAILILNPAIPPINMQTTIYAKVANPDVTAIRREVNDMVARLVRYVPGYELLVPPTLVGDRLMTTVKVMGNGDYLPSYAGNLDIINCAAIAVAEMIAESRINCDASNNRSEV